MKKIVDHKFASAVAGVILLLLVSVLSACIMLKVFEDAGQRDAEDFIKIARNGMMLSLGVSQETALPSRKVVRYINGITSPDIEGFYFTNLDVLDIAKKLPVNEASFDIKQDSRNIWYIFAGTRSGDKAGFVATQLDPYPVLSGLGWIYLGVILVSAVLAAAVLCYICRTVTLHIASICYKLPDLAAFSEPDGKIEEGEIEERLKERFGAGSYPLAQLNTLVDRLCAIFSSYCMMRRRFGESMEPGCKTKFESKIKGIEERGTASAVQAGTPVKAKIAPVWVFSLLLVCLLSATAMLAVFFRTAARNSEDFIKAARNTLKLEMNIPLDKALSSDDRRVVEYIEGITSPDIEGFHFTRPDVLSIAKELHVNEAEASFPIKENSRNIPYIFAGVRSGDKTGFVAAELYPHSFLRGLALTLFGVILVSLALTAAVLLRMHRAVTSRVELICGKLSRPDFFEVHSSDESAVDKLKKLREYLYAGTYPLRQLNLLVERLCPVMVNYFEMRGRLGEELDDYEKHNMESVMRFQEEGQIMAAEYTRLSYIHEELEIDCALEDFDIIGEAKQAKMANLLDQAVRSAVRRGASEISVHFGDGADDAIIFEVKDDKGGDVSEREKEDMLAWGEKDFKIDMDTAGCIFSVTIP